MRWIHQIVDDLYEALHEETGVPKEDLSLVEEAMEGCRRWQYIRSWISSNLPSMSTKVSSNRRAYSSSTGRVAEVRFVRAARNKGLLVTKSLHTEDRHAHIDYWLAIKPDNKVGGGCKGNNFQMRSGVSSRM